MKHLEIEIPPFTLRRRAVLEFNSETKKLKVVGIDIDEMPASIFQTVQIGENSIEEEPFTFDIEGDEFNSDIVLFPMGHYREQPFAINVSFNTSNDIQLVYDCIYNLEFGWNVLNVQLEERIQLIEVDYEAFYKTVELSGENEGNVNNSGKKKKEDTSQWHSIVPLETCPHVDEFVHSSDGISEGFRSNSCFKCNDKTENWYCLKCGQVFCSRYVNSHGVNHYDETGHAILMSFTDLSTWCYLCDYYINDVAIKPALYLLHMTKFKVPHPSDTSGMFVSRYYCNICTNPIKKVLYHCTVCDDYDICQQCLNNGEFSEPHTSEHEVETRNV